MNKYIYNTSWQLLEYGLKLVASIFVTIYIARYLGPSKFGLISYLMSIIVIFMSIARLGMESILVRELTVNPSNRKNIIGTSFYLIIFGSIISILLMLAGVYFFSNDSSIQLYFIILSFIIIFQSSSVIDYNFQSQLNSKYSSLVKSTSLIISSGIKLVLVHINADFFYFVVAISIDHLLVFILLFALHYKINKFNFIFYFKTPVAKSLLKSSWPMIISGLAGMIYTKIDQIMIERLLGMQEVGIYAASAKIFEGWVMIPYIVSISLLPAIINLKKISHKEYEKGLTKIISLLFWVSFIVATIVSFYSSSIIELTFGKEFSSSSSVLSILIWAALFSTLGSINGRYMTVENYEKKIAKRMLISLILNIFLNLFFILNFGTNGAAYATLITVIITNYFLNYLDKDLKELVIINNNAILLR
jgi:O-antigen/teichoic acid export membrane protein